MLVLLADLSHELAEHFALEERGGYFDDIRRVAPQLDRQLGSLQSDHLALLERSRGLLELAGRSVAQPSRWDGVASGLADLLTRIDAHEHTENELIQRALMNDHGGSG